MKNSNALRDAAAKAMRRFTAAGFLAIFWWPLASFAAAEAGAMSAKPAPTSAQAISTPSPTGPQSPEAKLREQWQREIAKVPLPKKGCYNASYPSKQWKEVPCGARPKLRYPNQPGAAAVPNNVGYGNSVAARSAGLISSAVGSFDSVTPATVAASGPVRGNPTMTAPDAFSLQLNSQGFNTAACAGVAGCQGWQQFIYSRYQCVPGPCIFIEYWLLGYGATCPASWQSAGSGGHCYRNAAWTTAPGLSAAQLLGTTLTGMAAGGPGGDDQVVLTTSGGSAVAATSPTLLGLAQQWNAVEWNVVGDCCASRVDFSPNTSIVARVIVNDGSPTPPTCVVPNPSTAESNNLNFGPNAPAASGAGPALIFMESSAGGMPPNCNYAATVGDTHLATFMGLFYDFQATGDFVLAQLDKEFIVQTRQVSGRPQWPDASVNSAVAVRMGKTRVAICLAPARLVIEGKPAELDDGKMLAFADRTEVSRRGNAYLVRGASGHSVRAEVNATWINVNVGLGRWPAKVSGLLANVQDDVNKIAARDGTVLTHPFAFSDLYGRFAESWRVEPNESMLSVCGDKEVERGIPRKPFYAGDLDAKAQERARGVCVAADVKVPALLEACTLDVAVIGNDAAARVFVGMREPVAVARVIAGAPDEGGWWQSMRWLQWLAFLAIVVGLLFLVLRRRKNP